MPNYGDINNYEHNQTSIRAKRVILYGWDSDNLSWVRIAVDANGLLQSGDPSKAYKISDEDGAEPGYAGYVRSDGYWYIMKSVTSGNITTYRYAKGNSGYSTNWTNRGTLTYNYFNVEF